MNKQHRFEAPQVVKRADVARVTRLAIENDGGLAMEFKVGEVDSFDRADIRNVKLSRAMVSPQTQAAVDALIAQAYNELVRNGHLPAGTEEDVPEPVKEVVAEPVAVDPEVKEGESR